MDKMFSPTTENHLLRLSPEAIFLRDDLNEEFLGVILE